MPHRSFYDQQPEPEHPAKRERPHAVASLFVHTAEWPDLDRIREVHGPTEIVRVRPVPIIPAFMIEVVCTDQSTALALMAPWLDYCATSPRRPRTEAEREALNRKLVEPEFANLPPDWTV
jgi:hypothetical protein